MKSAQASQSRGFTLIELLITIAVLTILVVIALPSFFGAIDRRRVVDATEAIGKQVEQARITAIETNRRITMVFDTAAVPWCFGLTDDADCQCNELNSCTIPFGITEDESLLPTAPEEVVGTGNQFPGVELISAPDSMRFEPRRGTRDDGVNTQTIILESPRGLRAHVMVNVIGRVSTCSPAGAANVSVMKTCPVP